jgi:hypothetical protein
MRWGSTQWWEWPCTRGRFRRDAHEETEKKRCWYLTRGYCGCKVSSSTAFPPLSTVTTLLIGAYPLKLMSIT